MYLVIFASIALKLENVGPKTKQSYFKAEVVALLLKVQKMLQFGWWFTKIFERKSTKKILNVWKLTNTGVIVDIICEHNLHSGEWRFNDKRLNKLFWFDEFPVHVHPQWRIQGRGPGLPPPPPPLIFRPNWGSKAPPPSTSLSQGLVDRPPSFLKVWIRHWSLPSVATGDRK